MPTVPSVSDRDQQPDNPPIDSLSLLSEDDDHAAPSGDPIDDLMDDSMDDATEDLEEEYDESSNSTSVDEVDGYDTPWGRLRNPATGVIMLQTKLLQLHFNMAEASRSTIESVHGPDVIRAVLRRHNRLFARSIMPPQTSWTAMALGRRTNAGNGVEISHRAQKATDEQSRLFAVIEKLEQLRNKRTCPETIDAADDELFAKYGASYDLQLADVACEYLIDDNDLETNTRLLESLQPRKTRPRTVLPAALPPVETSPDPVWIMKQQLISEMDPIARHGMDNQPPLSSVRDELLTNALPPRLQLPSRR